MNYSSPRARRAPTLPLADIDNVELISSLISQNAFSIMFNRLLEELARCDKWDFNHIFLHPEVKITSTILRFIMKGGAPRHKLKVVELITSVSTRDRF